MLTTSEQQPLVNNSHPKPCQTKVITNFDCRTSKERPLCMHNGHFLGSQGWSLKTVLTVPVFVNQPCSKNIIYICIILCITYNLSIFYLKSTSKCRNVTITNPIDFKKNQCDFLSNLYLHNLTQFFNLIFTPFFPRMSFFKRK